MNRKMIGTTIFLCLLVGSTTVWSAERATPGRIYTRSSPIQNPAPQSAQVPQQIPQPVNELNKIPVRVQPQNVQAKLQEALGKVETSQQQLKAAVAAMNSYLDREAQCVGKNWSAQDMEAKCSPQDTLQQCKDKLVAACAKGHSPGKAQLWANVQNAADDVSQKALAVKSVYNSIGGGSLPVGGQAPIGNPFSVY